MLIFPPRRLKQQAGRHALVDGIAFTMPVSTKDSPAIFATFSIDPERARAMLPGKELHPYRLWGRGLLTVCVANYQETDIGKYIEFGIAIACTRGPRPAPRLLPALFSGFYGFGQYIYDLPVSTEVSVKGGRGIWGMPKRRASLSFDVDDDSITSQYDLDGKLVAKLEVRRPERVWLPVRMGAAGYGSFRGMLTKSYLYLHGTMGHHFRKKGAARLVLGDHPRAEPLKALDISERPLFAGYIPRIGGVLDDHVETWYLTHDAPPTETPPGLETVVDLGLSQEWPPPPSAPESSEDRSTVSR